MWTNVTLRRELGERGFLPASIMYHDLDTDTYRSKFVKGDIQITLIEYREEREEPYVMRNNQRINVEDLGVRNVNLRQKTEGNQT